MCRVWSWVALWISLRLAFDGCEEICKKLAHSRVTGRGAELRRSTTQFLNNSMADLRGPYCARRVIGYFLRSKGTDPCVDLW